MFRLFPLLLAMCVAMGFSPVRASGEDAQQDEGRTELIPVPTLGGKQFWADELFFHQWRIQRNALSGECRLLDGYNLRHASGSFEACHNKLSEIKLSRRLPPMEGRAVVVLHGLGRTRASMEKLCRCLREHGFSVFNVSYPSTRRSIADHAQSLARIVENLRGIDEIHFVGHSMGNIVIRRYLFDLMDRETGRLRDGRLGRIVMLGPPNQGSCLAASLADNALFNAIEGVPGRELGVGWDELERKLATPPLEFGVIAGGRNNAEGYNPALPGDDDGIVTVASTRLEGAADYVLVPVPHSFLMNDDAVAQQVLRFLETGRFAASETP